MSTPTSSTKSSSNGYQEKELKKLKRSYRIASRKILQESDKLALANILNIAAAYSGKDLPAPVAQIFIALSVEQVCEELLKKIEGK